MNPSALNAAQRQIAGDYAAYLQTSRNNPFATSGREGWVAVSPKTEAEAKAHGAKTTSQVLDYAVYGDFLPAGARAEIRRQLGFK